MWDFIMLVNCYNGRFIITAKSLETNVAIVTSVDSTEYICILNFLIPQSWPYLETICLCLYTHACICTSYECMPRWGQIIILWILDKVYGVTFPVKVYISPSCQARENIHFDREYESIYSVKNLSNEYVLLQKWLLNTKLRNSSSTLNIKQMMKKMLAIIEYTTVYIM
jgi:hypothetical protein